MVHTVVSTKHPEFLILTTSRAGRLYPVYVCTSAGSRSCSFLPPPQGDRLLRFTARCRIDSTRPALGLTAGFPSDRRYRPSLYGISDRL